MQVVRAMSSKSKKAKSLGVRYTPEQKKEIVEFVQQYNEANGRGGQSAAVSKFKVTPITIGAWLKAAGVSKKKGKPAKAAKAAKPAKAMKKAAKKAKGGAKKGSKGAGKRYSAAEKQEVIDFVNSYNASNGRGGQSEAARKFNISILTVSAWLKKSGNKVAKGGKALAAGKSSAKVSSALTAKVASLIQMSDRIQKAELELAKLRAGYESLKSSIKAVI
jgi:transposase-like protein